MLRKEKEIVLKSANDIFMSNRWILSLLRPACGHVDVGTCPHQVLAATLTLSQPGGQIMPTLYTGVHTKS